MSDKTKLLAQLGFGSIFILILILSYFMLSHFSIFREHMSTIVENNNTKSELASTMRDSIRMRAISLRNMLVTEDVFLRDEEMLRFNTYAAQFAAAKEELVNLPKTSPEIKIIKMLNQAIQSAQPLNRKASDFLLSDNNNYEETKLIVNQAFMGQEIVLDLLDELVELQKKSSTQALINVNEEYESTKNEIIAVITLVGLIAFFILFAIGRFITQKNRELRVATESKSMFLANMSHEIRTPLTAIIGFSKLLHAKQISVDKQKSTLETVIKNAEHLLHIINDILDISKIEANHLELDLKEFSLCDFMNDIQNMVEGPIKKKGLEFVANYRFPLPAVIKSDDVRLKQVMVNLCSNATKFTEQGHIVIDVYFDRETNLLHFSVTDSGIGLTPNQSEKIFDSFQQAESSTTRKFGGTGLGLSISHQLVSKLGGELTVTSKPNDGSCFKFFISLNDSDLSSLCYSKSEFNHIGNADNENDESIRVKGHILLVDDTVDNQVLISTYLNDMGAEVIIADNGKDAVDIATKNSFDLILMDMQMPVMSGIEAVRLIRMKNAKVPIAMLTANAFKEERDQCYEAGCNNFLTKPIDIAALQRIVGENLTMVEKQDSDGVKDNIQDIDKAVGSRKIDDSLDEENIIISRLMGSSERIDKMIKDFVLQLPNYISDIENAYINKDMKKLSYATHQLKGVGGNYGFLMITETCHKTEEAIKNNHIEDINDYLDELKDIVIGINAGLGYYARKQKLA